MSEHQTQHEAGEPPRSRTGGWRLALGRAGAGTDADALAWAVLRARLALAWEGLWPALARLLTIGGLFVATAWSGLLLMVPVPVRLALLAVFAVAMIAALWPLRRWRQPDTAAALARLDRNSGLRHRPISVLTEKLSDARDPVTAALWQAHVARTRAAIARVRAGWPQPRLALHDPEALRVLVALAVVVTFIAAGEERGPRLSAALSMVPATHTAATRFDAWVTPPAYTRRPPVILTALTAPDSAQAAEAIVVPAGSILTLRASGGALKVTTAGPLTPAPAETAASAGVASGRDEQRFVIAGDGEVRVGSRWRWQFTALPDHAPVIALAKEPERQAQGALLLTYTLEDDYGVTTAEAVLIPQRLRGQPNDARMSRPLYEAPRLPLALPQARTRQGTGQTYKDLSEHPFAGALVSLILTARDDAGNEGQSAAHAMRLPERVFRKPLARVLIEQRRLLALDANRAPLVQVALDALLVAPEVFTPEAGFYLGLNRVAAQLRLAQLTQNDSDDRLRAVVDGLWSLAVLIEDGTMSDAEKALRAAQDALRQALDNGAGNDEIAKLMDALRSALNNYMRQLAEEMRKRPQQEARPLDRNTRVMRPEDLRKMLDRMQELAQSGNKNAAQQMLEDLRQMLENLQTAQPGSEAERALDQAMNELGDVIRKQQQLRDKTYDKSQDSRRDRMRGDDKDKNKDLGDLNQDQQGLRDRLKALREALRKQGIDDQAGGNDPGNGQGKAQRGEGERGQGPGQKQRGGGDGESGGLGDADSAMAEAGQSLQQGDADGAVTSQGRAIEALRKGAQALAQQMQQMMGERDGGPGNRLGRQQGSGAENDPLGRPLRGREVDDSAVKIPGEIDTQRARRILEELRRRYAEPDRPQLELDYIERLLRN